jgi:hypothetical protein
VVGFVFLHSNGRLGNQLIELLGASSTFPGKNIIAINFNEARSFLQSTAAQYWIGSDNSYSLLSRTFAKLIWLIRKLPNFALNIFFSVAVENTSNNIDIYPPLIRLFDIIWVDGPYFQNLDLLDTALMPRFKSRDQYSCLAVDYLNLFIHPNNSQPVYNIFLHVRLGDYLRHDLNRVDSNRYVLPQQYYHYALTSILSRFKLPHHIFVASDDADIAKIFFPDLENCTFINESSELTLSILSLCDAGILSASSFSWWAAHYAIIHNKKQGPFIAPKYWLGFSQKEWHPTGFQSAYLEYREVN